VRRIDFRSWARLGKPVVREYQEEYYCRIALILDTHVVPKKTWGSFERWAEGWYFPYEQGPEEFPELEAVCQHCRCKIVGHGIEANGTFYCCAHCAREQGVTAVADHD
jgi:hypothetical protein